MATSTAARAAAPPAAPNRAAGGDDAQLLSLTAHLLELRKRLLLAALGLLAGAVGGWFLFPPATRWLFSFVTDALPEAGLNFRTVLAPFTVRLSFSMWAGLIISSPWWLAQGWLFLAPALRKREKKVAAAIVVPSAALFLTGVGAALWFLPRAVGILLTQVPEGARALLDADSYLRFVSILTLVIGVSFLFPVAVVSAHALGLVTVRRLVGAWRWAVLAAYTFAAITNPLPDLWSMILQGAALIALYYAAVGVCALREWRPIQRWRQRAKRVAQRKTAS